MLSTDLWPGKPQLHKIKEKAMVINWPKEEHKSVKYWYFRVPKLIQQLTPNSPFDHNEVSLQWKQLFFTSSLSSAPFKCTQWHINCKHLVLASRSSLVNGFWNTSAINSFLFHLGLYLLLYTLKFCILLVILYYSYYKVLSLWVILIIFNTYYYGSKWIKLIYL